VADDLDREAVVLVAIEAWCVHAPSMAQQVSADKPLNKLTYMDPPPVSRDGRAATRKRADAGIYPASD
jgi:hypothetical protein